MLGGMKQKLRRVVLTVEIITPLTVRELRSIKRLTIESGSRTVDHQLNPSATAQPALAQAHANAVPKGES